MSRLTEALKKLGAKCTSQAAQVQGDNVEHIIECIAEHYACGSVPEVTNVDEGKVLVVQNGVWTAKEIAVAEETEV